MDIASHPYMAQIPFWGASHVVPGLAPPLHPTPPHPNPKLSYWTIHTLIIISIFKKKSIKLTWLLPNPTQWEASNNPALSLSHPLPIMGLIINFGATFSEKIRASLECLDSRAKVKYHPCWYLVLSIFGGQDHTLNQCFLVENNSNGGVQSNSTSLL
jgi:hypothetical protein